MAQDQASAGLVSLLNEFSSLLRGFRGGVVYRMAMQRRLVASIATAYSCASTAERTDAICFLAAADESVDHPRGTRSVVEALLAASTTLPGGPIFPITLRADLLRLLSRPGSHEVFNAQTLSRLEHLETVLRWLFLRQSAIRVRRLSVVEPEALLSFLQRIEAVHPFSSRSELERRLGQDAGRAAFGLFFAGMPDTPLVVVYVAIGCEHNPPASVASLLNGVWGSSERTVPTTACFYSITNCVDGLQGLQLGSYLIFLAMEELRHAYPSLSSFVTLSPAPLFGSWLRRRLSDLERPLQPQDARFVRELDQFVTSASALPEADARSREAACSPWLRQQLTRHAAMYVLFERRRTNEFMPSYIDSRTRFPPSKCVDPVANFHVSNGGLVDRVLCCADLSSRGLATSFSCMVNYRYDAEFLSGRAPAWRYSSLGVLSSYRLARHFCTGDSFIHAIASDVCDDDLRVSPVFARTCHAGETLASPFDEDAFGFHIIVAGSVDVFSATPPSTELSRNPLFLRHTSGSEVSSHVLFKVVAGEILGAVPEPTSTCISFVARASADCLVVVVPLETVHQLEATCPTAALELRRRAVYPSPHVEPLSSTCPRL